MNILEMKKKDFDAIQEYNYSDWLNDKKIDFDNVVIIPTTKTHDSGFKCMKYVLCKRDNPVCAIDQGSDVIHLDGAGGFGIIGKKNRIPDKIDIHGWRIDCLPCGYLRLFSNKNVMSLGSINSDTEFYAGKQGENE